MPDNYYKDLEVPLCNADLLSIERNKLSNERTLLSYSRTFLTFIVAGATLIQFFNNMIFVYLGYALIPTGILIFIIGLCRYYRTKKRITSIRESLPAEDEDHID